MPLIPSGTHSTVLQSYSLNIKYYPSIYRKSKHFKWNVLAGWMVYSFGMNGLFFWYEFVLHYTHHFPLIDYVALKYDRKSKENLPHTIILLYLKKMYRLIHRFRYCRAKVVFVIWDSKEGWFYLLTVSRQFFVRKEKENVCL